MCDDGKNLDLIRKNVDDLWKRAAEENDLPDIRILDVAPQQYGGVGKYLQKTSAESLDINPAEGCTYTGDITKTNDFLADGSFDVVVCTEVLEHVRQPFDAVAEIWRLLKPGGFLYGSTPLNLYIHPPEPDCWRFTHFGLQELLKNFSSVEIVELPEPGRHFPVHYTFKAQKPWTPSVSDGTIKTEPDLI